MPSEQEAAAAGFTPADYEQEVELWPECAPAWGLFTELRTQWRTGMGGAIGLDYGVLFTRLDRLGLAGTAWEDLFADVRTLESAALAQMAQNG